MRIRLSLLFLLVTSPAYALESVNVMADNSLNIVLTRIARDYSREHDIVVNTSFVAPAIQQTQITEGAPADVLITPENSWIDALKSQGLIDVYSQVPVARDTLVLAGPENSPLDFKLSKGFPTALLIWQIGLEPGFVVGNPQALPEGIYGKEALRAMNAAADLEPYTLYVKRRDQMLEMLAGHDYGVVFSSDVAGYPGIRIFDAFPDNTYKPIQYYAVVLAGENMAGARKFMAYLKSDVAKKQLRDGGFTVD